MLYQDRIMHEMRDDPNDQSSGLIGQSDDLMDHKKSLVVQSASSVARNDNLIDHSRVSIVESATLLVGTTPEATDGTVRATTLLMYRMPSVDARRR